jgi:hypothetical protein
MADPLKGMAAWTGTRHGTSNSFKADDSFYLLVNQAK